MAQSRFRSAPLFGMIAGALAVTMSPSAAGASASGWVETEGGSVRLVTTGTPDAQGRLRGMLDIALKPGWKTYWIDPGDAGVPPMLDTAKSTNLADATMDFPAPQRHEDAGNIWAGYAYPVAFPILFQAKDPNGALRIDASVFLGICETICIPVQADLIVDPAADPDNADDAMLVKAAFEALPGPETATFKATGERTDEGLKVQVTVPGKPAELELFVSGMESYTLGAAERRDDQGRPAFFVPVYALPARLPSGPGLRYALVADGRAVTGFLPYP